MTASVSAAPERASRAQKIPDAVLQAFASTHAALGRAIFAKTSSIGSAPIAVIARWQHGAASVELVQPGVITLVMSLADGQHVRQRRSGLPLADRVRNGSITIFSPHQPARVVISGQADVLQLFVSQSFVETTTEAAYGCPTLTDVRNVELQAAFMQMLVAASCEDPDDRLRLQEVLQDFAHRLTSRRGVGGGVVTPARGQGGLSPAAFRRVQDRIEATLDGADAPSLSLAEMAAAANLSVSHFVRAFRTHVGTTPYKYLSHRRMERAISLLRAPNGSVATVADRVGFATPAHFVATFRTAMGVTPGKVREALTSRPPRKSVSSP